MKTIIADTSALISLLSPMDANHGRAVHLSQYYAGERGSIVLPPDVFTETMNVMGRRSGHADALAAADYLLRTSAFLIAKATPELRHAALATFARQPQSVSYTDCVVMACAEEYRTTRIFGFDEAFGKHEFRRIQKEATAHAA